MVTYSDLFQLCILIVALVSLCYQIFKGEKIGRHTTTCDGRPNG